MKTLLNMSWSEGLFEIFNIKTPTLELTLKLN